MNWPALTAECSQAIADVLKDVVHKRPKDLFATVAAELERKSGIDPAEFAAHFEECKRRPRTYVLEDRCPDGEDPLTWVPMRYNDDTITLTCQGRAGELLTDVLSTEALPSGRELFDRAMVAYPELMYLRGSPVEALAAQTIRGLFLCCSGCTNTLEEGLEDDDPGLTYRCKALLAGVKTSLLQPVALTMQASTVTNIEKLEALLVFLILQLLGLHEGFRERNGFGEQEPCRVALAAIEQGPDSVPSFRRMTAASQVLIKGTLQAHFPFAMLLAAEATPAHFLQLKELIVPIEGGLSFFLAATGVEYLATQRTVQVPQETQDIVRLTGICVPGVAKHSASRAYELYLRKRAERHQWRLMRDDYMHRAIIRLCCMVGSEETKTWNEVQQIVESLAEDEKDVLKCELGKKDGLACTPSYVLVGSSSFMSQVASNPRLNLRSALRLLHRLLEALANTYNESGSAQIKVHLDALVARARDYSGGALFEDTPMTFDNLGPAEVCVRC